MKLEIIISEPWDFKSSDGENILKVKVLSNQNGIIKAEALSDYKGKNGHLILASRNNYGDVNIYQQLDKNEQIEFVMIGTFKDSYNRNNI